jgi:ubiquinone/menaquinone biosynthesis C-methylase UbiE
MRTAAVTHYRCPVTHARLRLKVTQSQGKNIIQGVLTSPKGTRYAIRGGLPDFTYPPTLIAGDAAARDEFERVAAIYDAYTPLTFRTFGLNETKIRNEMVDALHLKPRSKVLEFGCGTGRDSELIARRLAPGGRLYLQDISPAMLARCAARLRNAKVPVEYAVANGCYLPFPDRMFDAVYHFGGLNTFSDIKNTFREIARVTKAGGRVVVGDESMPPWLYNSEFGKILMNSNPMFRHPLPLEHLPVEARRTNVHWIVGEVFYYIDFTVGKGEPKGDFDFTIPGARGGTHRTRYYGQLEGISPKAKKAALAAREKLGISMYEWLDKTVYESARAVLATKSAKTKRKSKSKR